MLDVNARGHVMKDGAPMTVPEQSSWYVGNAMTYIRFSYAHLPDGRVVVHSSLHEGGDAEPKETFLYEIVARKDAMRCAESMVDDAMDYLEASGVADDANGSASDFLSRLHVDLKNRLH